MVNAHGTEGWEGLAHMLKALQAAVERARTAAAAAGACACPGGGARMDSAAARAQRVPRLTRCCPPLAAGDASRQQACEGAVASLQDVGGWVSAGQVLSKYEVHLRVHDLQRVDSKGAPALLQRLLAHAER